MIFALIKAIEYCRHNKLKTFHKKDVDLNPVEYTLITFLVKF
jgi:histone H3/H4